MNPKKVNPSPRESPVVSEVTNEKKPDEEVPCGAGCGSTCHPEENVGGFCSRSCLISYMRDTSYD